jgi:hypothetical protein
MSAQFEAEMQEQVSILGDIALLGQWTVIYAPPNTGKTLIFIKLVIDGIKSGTIDPESLFYINADDNHQGLTAKLGLAERYGFHMLAPGYNEFRAKDFLDHLRKLCRKGQAKGTIVILDTLKKFTDLMDKRTASEFGNVIREFIAKGGTLIGLAHVNKKRDAEGILPGKARGRRHQPRGNRILGGGQCRRGGHGTAHQPGGNTPPTAPRLMPNTVILPMR